VDGVLLAALVLVVAGVFDATQPLGEASQFLGRTAAAAERLGELAATAPAVADPDLLSEMGELGAATAVGRQTTGAAVQRPDRGAVARCTPPPPRTHQATAVAVPLAADRGRRPGLP